MDFRYDQLAYENAGHVSRIPFTSTTETTEYGNSLYRGSPAVNARSTADHRSHVLDYLESSLDP